MMVLGKDSPVYKIFHWRFHCRVPQLALIDEEVQSEYGTYVSYDIKSAEQWARVPVDAQLTIDQMTELHLEGYAIVLVNIADATRIYDIVTEHFAMWLEYTRHAISKIFAPLEDFRAMDKLLQKLYPLADRGFRKENKATVLDDGLGDLLGLSGVVEVVMPSMDHGTILDEITIHAERVEAFRDGIGR